MVFSFHWKFVNEMLFGRIKNIERRIKNESGDSKREDQLRYYLRFHS
ncbi:hypothetical protein UNH65_12220 [Chitinophaga sp. 180180018-2]|nr:hypothetical protein [Chitinophaga sp. 212800010-3]